MAMAERVAVTAYSSFGPQSFRELPPAFHAQAKDTPLLLDLDVVQHPARRLNKTPAQVLLRWATQRNVAIIPKSINLVRMQQNLEVTSGFELTEVEIESISALDQGLRFNDPSLFLDNFLNIFA